MKQKRFPRWLRKLLRRRFLITFLIIAQAASFVYLITSGSMLSQRLSRLLTITSILVVLHVVSKRDKGAYKTMWVFLILSFPVLGGLLYLLINFQTPTKKMSQDIQQILEKTKALYPLPGDGYQEAKQITGSHFSQIRYLKNYAGFTVYSNTRTTYL